MTMNKQRIRQVMLGLEADGLQATMEAYCDYFASARADRSEPVQVDEHVQAVFARELAEAVHQPLRSEEHTSELQSLMRISYAVFCLKKKTKKDKTKNKNKSTKNA